METTKGQNMTKYPDIEVDLIGRDGNAFAVLGNVKTALRRGGVEQVEIDEFMAEAMSGDYNHLLATVARWVEIADAGEDEDDADAEWDEYWADEDEDDDDDF